MLAAVANEAKRNSGLPAEEAFAILQTFGMRYPGDVSGVTGGILGRMVTRRQVIYKRAKGRSVYGVYFLPGPVHRLRWALLDAARFVVFSPFRLWDALSGVTARPRERWATFPRRRRRALGVLAVVAIVLAIVLAPIGISILITGMPPEAGPPGTSVTATGSVDQASVVHPDCAPWKTREFFEQATAADVARFISQGADPNAGKSTGLTPTRPTSLHKAAAFSETPEVVKALLDAGANPKARDSEGRIPVELIPSDSPLRGTDIYWRLNEARYR